MKFQPGGPETALVEALSVIVTLQTSRRFVSGSNIESAAKLNVQIGWAKLQAVIPLCEY